MSHPRSAADAAIEARAAAWLAQRDDAFTDAEAADFARWRAADPRHEAAVTRLEATWALLRQLSDYRPQARAHPDSNLLGPPRRRGMTWSQALGAAAAIAILALTGWSWLRPTADENPPQIYATTAGGYQRLTLEDGSVIELNSDSEVQVNYSAHERRLRLMRGEAHFTVAKNQARPFFVRAGDLAVRAVGTAFDVRLGERAVEVMVTAGIVELNRTTTDGARPLLHAGWRAVVSTADAAAAPVLAAVTPDDMRDALAWHGSRLTFIETPLAEVVEQFNRHNTVQLELRDPELASMPVGGSFSANNLAAFVRLLSANGEIVVEQPSVTRIVLRKAP